MYKTVEEYATKRAVMRFNPVLKKYKKDVDFCAPVQYNKSCL